MFLLLVLSGAAIFCAGFFAMGTEPVRRLLGPVGYWEQKVAAYEFDVARLNDIVRIRFLEVKKIKATAQLRYSQKRAEANFFGEDPSSAMWKEKQQVDLELYEAKKQLELSREARRKAREALEEAKIRLQQEKWKVVEELPDFQN